MHHIISKHHDVPKFPVQHYHNGPINISQSNLAHVVEASEPVHYVLQRVSIRLETDVGDILLRCRSLLSMLRVLLKPLIKPPTQSTSTGVSNVCMVLSRGIMLTNFLVLVTSLMVTVASRAAIASLRLSFLGSLYCELFAPTIKMVLRIKIMSQILVAMVRF